MSLIDEKQIEQQSINWFKELGYDHKNGFEVSPERQNPCQTNSLSSAAML